MHIDQFLTPQGTRLRGGLSAVKVRAPVLGGKSYKRVFSFWYLPLPIMSWSVLIMYLAHSNLMLHVRTPINSDCLRQFWSVGWSVLDVRLHAHLNTRQRGPVELYRKWCHHRGHSGC